MNTTHKSDGDEVYIQRLGEVEDERICIGLLHELRSDAGDLTEMFIEPFEGTLDNLVGDNLIYFKKINSELYRFSRFEQYPDCDEITVEPEDKPSRPNVTNLGTVLKEAEETISRVRQGLPIQKIDPTRTSGPKIENLTRPTRPSRLGLARPPR
jgi:hypothetical protein